MDIANWNRKELQEQEYVTLHIERVLIAFSVKDYHQKWTLCRQGRKSVAFAHRFHLFMLQSGGSKLPSLINALHPTPAVCGMTSGKAMDFIRQH